MKETTRDALDTASGTPAREVSQYLLQGDQRLEPHNDGVLSTSLREASETLHRLVSCIDQEQFTPEDRHEKTRGSMPSPTSLLALTDEQIIILERRVVYGRGTVETLATIDESGTLLLEERAGDDIRIIPIVTSAGQGRLREMLVEYAATRSSSHGRVKSP